MKFIERNGVIGWDLFVPAKPTDNNAALIEHEGKIYNRVQSDLFVGFQPMEIHKTRPYLTWCGEKIPLELWHKTLRFFAWSYDTTRSETQVRLYYNKSTRTWKVWAFPQEADTGMSAREISGDAHNAQFAQHIGPGFMPLVTVHHHCAAPAFQSGTDRANEQDQDGLHITVGNMGRETYELHSRVYYHKTEYGAALGDWFDVPIPEVAENIRHLLRPDWKTNLVERTLVIAPPKSEWEDFPPEWKANLIKVNRYVGKYGGAGGFQAGGLQSTAAGDFVWGEHDDWSRRLDDDGGKIQALHYPAGKASAGNQQARVPTYGERLTAACDAVVSTASVYNIEADELLECLESCDAPIVEALEEIVEYDVQVSDVIRTLKHRSTK